jgi:predicted nucleic acid-binding protein
MSVRAFVDTNVWVYAVDTADKGKRQIALDLLAPSPDKDYIISVQVIGEFYSTVTGKLRQSVGQSHALAMVERMQRLSVVPLDLSIVSQAIAESGRWQISYWDALIVAAAKVAGCGVILSEDLSDGASYGQVTVENPFVASTA